MQVDMSLLATCLFFAHSSVSRHRNWAQTQLEAHPELADIQDFQDWKPGVSASSVAETRMDPVIPDRILMRDVLSRMASCEKRAALHLHQVNL